MTGTFGDLDFEALERELAPRPQRFWRPIKSQRILQIVLGLFWLLDAGLQFQSFMFHRSFVETYVLPNANGQPAVIAWVITNIGHFIEPHIALWNTLFALTQVAIGLGLLYRPTVRCALALSFACAFGVWVVGEGMGMVLTGSASALTGAPGAVFMYAMVGLMAWPSSRADTEDEVTVGVASSAAARGVGGVTTPLLVWAGYWSLAAVLFLLPHNRTSTSLSSAITGMAPGEPSPFSHFLTSFGNLFSSVGTEGAWVLAALALVIGFGPLLSRRPGVFLLGGALLSLVMWVGGQAFGGILTGSGTDPNTGPMIVVLALAMTPACVAAPFVGSTPLGQAWRDHRVRVLAGGGIALVALAIFLSAAYPAPATESTGTAMSGMTGMAGKSGSGNSAATASCTGSGHSGLVVNISPIMTMGGDVKMNMNGADASAAAGLNSTKANWHYTGPPLPQADAQQLLADGGNGPGRIHMAQSGCAPEPTFSDQINAEQYVQSTSQAVARYANPAAAVAAGYQPVSPTDYPVVYYVNPQIVAANAAAKRTLDPNHIDGLVYATTPTGQQVLAAAFYLPPSTVSSPPMPFGSLVQWHQRTDVCAASGSAASGQLAISGSPPCPSGSLVSSTPYMTMVWQVPVAGGPTAIQPPDIQIVEAAIMQAGG